MKKLSIVQKTFILIALVSTILFANKPKTAYAQAVEISDSVQLVAFYHATNGEDWTNNEGWLTEPITNWFGIELSNNGRRVTRIDLSENGLTGSLPPLIELPALRVLDISINEVGGTISRFVCPDLRRLMLSSNSLTGELPDFNLPALDRLFFSYNNIEGALPSLSNCLNLEHLLADNNLLTNVPNLDHLKALKTLNLGWNPFLSEIPDFQLPLLEEIYLGSTNVAAPLPALDSLPSLIIFDADMGAFIGDVPSFASSTKLEYLSIDKNNLDGIIPDLSHLQSLKELDLDGNQLHGKLWGPLDFPEMTDLNLENNQLTDSIIISNLPKLQELGITDNNFTFLSEIKSPNIFMILAHDNRLDFNSIEPNYTKGVLKTFHNQACLPIERFKKYQLSVPATGSHEECTYTIHKESEIIGTKQANNTFFIRENGIYHIEVFNPVVNMTLCSEEVAIEDISSLESVWSGDANHDGIVDEKDLLNIGEAFGSNGAARESDLQGSTAWMNHFVEDWAGFFESGLNYKYADTNGDGEVDEADITAIFHNYGLTHNDGDDLKLEQKNYSLSIGAKEEVIANVENNFPIDFSLPNDESLDVLGVSFRLSAVIAREGLRINDPMLSYENSALNQQSGNNFIHLDTIFQSDLTSNFEAGISRTDSSVVVSDGDNLCYTLCTIGIIDIALLGNNSSSNQVPHEVTFTVEDIVFSLAGNKLIKGENSLPKTVTVLPPEPTSISSINPPNPSTRLYPNPAKAGQMIYLDRSVTMSKTVKIYNIHGQQLLVLPVRDNRFLLPDGLVGGVYFVEWGEQGNIARLFIL